MTFPFGETGHGIRWRPDCVLHVSREWPGHVFWYASVCRPFGRWHRWSAWT